MLKPSLYAKHFLLSHRVESHPRALIFSLSCSWCQSHLLFIFQKLGLLYQNLIFYSSCFSLFSFSCLTIRRVAFLAWPAVLIFHHNLCCCFESLIRFDPSSKWKRTVSVLIQSALWPPALKFLDLCKVLHLVLFMRELIFDHSSCVRIVDLTHFHHLLVVSYRC